MSPINKTENNNSYKADRPNKATVIYQIYTTSQAFDVTQAK